MTYVHIESSQDVSVGTDKFRERELGNVLVLNGAFFFILQTFLLCVLKEVEFFICTFKGGVHLQLKSK